MLVVIDVAGGKAFVELAAAVQAAGEMEVSVAGKRKRVCGESRADGEGRGVSSDSQMSDQLVHGESCVEVVNLVGDAAQADSGNAGGENVEGCAGVSWCNMRPFEYVCRGLLRSAP